MDADGIRRLIEGSGSGMFETAHVTTFKGHRENGAGDIVEITVEVLDLGPEAGVNRYAASAYSADGKTANGNHAATLEEAIPIVHWNQLD